MCTLFVFRDMNKYHTILWYISSKFLSKNYCSKKECKQVIKTFQKMKWQCQKEQKQNKD